MGRDRPARKGGKMLFEFAITLKNRADGEENIGFYNPPIGEKGSYFDGWRAATQYAIELLAKKPMSWYIDKIEHVN